MSVKIIEIKKMSVKNIEKEKMAKNSVRINRSWIKIEGMKKSGKNCDNWENRD